MKIRTRFIYRVACQFEDAPNLELEVPDQQAAIREAWKAAGNPCVTSVQVLRAPEGSFSFRPVHNIKG